ncbi:hypothetical protein DPMN_156343 [Dreissena polymorpha]|uniref:Uncharacterized protein n=1 Tax=Dreissena polymorpha TaxID=45954 RepID=A0A9D4FU79_DREPO|nr:hypothetical protein DPMN_156343 [Dreissena polymorpha]
MDKRVILFAVFPIASVFIECWAQFAEKGEKCGGWAGTQCNDGLRCVYSGSSTAGRCKSGGFVGIFAPSQDIL